MHDKDYMAMVASYIQSHGQPLDPPKEVNSSGPEELGSIPRHANIFYFLFFSQLEDKGYSIKQYCIAL